MRDEDALASQRYIVAIELDGDQERQIRLALPITEGEIRDLFDDQIHWKTSVNGQNAMGGLWPASGNILAPSS